MLQQTDALPTPMLYKCIKRLIAITVSDKKSALFNKYKKLRSTKQRPYEVF